MKKGISVRISGDLGDAVFMLPILQSIGGKNVIRCVDRPGVTAPFTNRVPMLKPLFEAQPYVGRMECSEDGVDIDLVPFRRWHSATTTLVASQATEYFTQSQEHPDRNIDGSRPWLTAKPDKSAKGRIIIARSPRYHNQYFPWKQIVEYYGQRILFVGLEHEHKTFCLQFGNVEYRATGDFLELAELIAGSDLFIGNQSSPHAVAIGLGHDMISEVCLEQPDCIYNRQNIKYVTTGSVILDDKSGAIPPLQISGVQNKDTISECAVLEVPPGLWQFPGLPPHTHVKPQCSLIMQMHACSEAEAMEKLVLYNIQRAPKFFADRCNHQFRLADEALTKAGLLTNETK